MNDLQDARLMWLKFLLFLVIGVLGTTGVVTIAPTLSAVAFHLLAIWAFCRVYYFVFYVIEHYIDANYRFAGLASFARYAWHQFLNRH